MTLQENLHALQQKVNNLCVEKNILPEKIKLVAVSKFQPVEKIAQAYALGVRDFGENYVQEWLDKKEKLAHLSEIRWHLIGPLQRNKVKFLDEKLFCLQSLNSLACAKEIEKKWSGKTPLSVLIQLQVDPLETQKSGISFKEAIELTEFLMDSRHMRWDGFMGIGPNTDDQELLKNLYANFVQNCLKIWNSYSINQAKKPVVSLGMSQDLEVALECGSNMVRVGTAIFGQRPTTKINAS